MYKNQLQELAQRSCFNLPSYSCIREGPDHAPRFKATVNFNGETFESPTFCSTLRHAEHAAAEVALSTLANRGPSRALAARVLDETGVYKNLLQETAHRAGLNLPVYTTVRYGPGHVPVFSCTVELAGMRFSGEPAKTKKQAQKNAAMAAWCSLKQLAQRDSSSTSYSSLLLESESSEEQEQVIIARVLTSLRPTEANKRSISMHSNSNPVAPSLYSMRYKNWDYSSSTAEMLMYQMWQRAHLLQLQSRLLPLPVPPAPPPVPHILPLMPPAIQPDPHLYFPARELETTTFEPGTTSASLSPSFYISNSSIPGSVRGRSMVTIQEIQEEKTEKSSNICPAQVLNPPVFGDREAAQEEKKQKGDGLEAKIGGSRQPEGNPTRQFEWMPHRSMDSGFRPVNFQPQKSHAFDSSQLNLRSHPPPRGTRPPSAASHITTMDSASPLGPRPRNPANQMPRPLKMRTGASPYLSKPRVEFGGVPKRFMAPAVQVRSVVPVCSAPPARKMPSTSDRGQVPDEVVKNTGQQAMSAASSGLSKLQI